jgi:hypothetical protein
MRSSSLGGVQEEIHFMQTYLAEPQVLVDQWRLWLTGLQEWIWQLREQQGMGPGML